ncbi:sulfite exporter TauE/SafE family protein [Litoreibacter arenae]|uniref:Probable membrane transporter protein n=1 Tax=Litoreibacter arenae DSM 19593 TaxID=1123360 RepID=S9QJJ2_9RHOB|nr:sulfite exporter TauE/SafE family protein [Litoreibacter arenae]EPX81586.1 INTEGRAL MEMBRANE PROTEIN (Rhomboid family) [Litoreibacter arenae DSM 19593]
MEFDATFFALALPAALIAGVAKGGFGGGAAFVATAILALFLPPATALGIMLPLLMIADLATLRPYWGEWHWPSAKALMLGGIPGVVLGAMLYQATNPDVLRVLIGVISLLFVAFQVARTRGWVSVERTGFSQRRGLVAGVVSGFTSFVSHAGGPPTAIFLLAQGMGKTTYQATTVLTFWAINAMKAVPYAFLGVFSWDTFRADLYMLPPLLVGVAVGVYAHRAMPERYFFLLTYALLVGAGGKLIFDGLT